jgi:hypothetical protein
MHSTVGFLFFSKVRMLQVTGSIPQTGRFLSFKSRWPAEMDLSNRNMQNRFLLTNVPAQSPKDVTELLSHNSKQGLTK